MILKTQGQANKIGGRILFWKTDERKWVKWHRAACIFKVMSWGFSKDTDSEAREITCKLQRLRHSL